MGSLRLAITLIAVVFVVLRESLMLGVALTVVRTAGIARWYEDIGQSMSFEEKVVTFLMMGFVIVATTAVIFARIVASIIIALMVCSFR